MSYKAIIFDLNGTLLLDSPLHEAAWIEAARELRKEPLTVHEFQLHGHGLTNKAIITYLLGREPDKELLNRVLEEKESRYRDLCLENSDVFKLAPGVSEFLDQCKTYGIPVTIATGSYLKNVEFYFKYLQLGNWFSLQNVVYDNGFDPGKPHPFIFEKAAKILGVRPGECVVFEDSYSGIKAACAAGIGRIITVEESLDPVKVNAIHPIYKMVAGFHEIDFDVIETY